MFGAETDKDALQIGAGVNIWTDNGSSVSLRYQGEFREHFWNNSGTLEYRVDF